MVIKDKISFDQAKAKIKEINENLTFKDFSNKEIVVIIQDDGSTFLFRDAFCVEYHDWLLVFTEHHNNHIYHLDETFSFGQYRKHKLAPILDYTETE